MINSFPQELFQKRCQEIVCETLGKNYINLFVSDFILREYPNERKSHVKYMLTFSNGWGDLHAEGTGAGVVDALFNSMMGFFCKDFFSLREVQFEDFSMEVKFNSFKIRPTDAPVEIKVALTNARQKRIYFSAQSRSLVLAGISAITGAFEYFVNAEMAFRQLQTDILEASTRNRTDLVNKYTNHAAELVKIVSYENIS